VHALNQSGGSIPIPNSAGIRLVNVSVSSPPARTDIVRFDFYPEISTLALMIIHFLFQRGKKSSESKQTNSVEHRAPLPQPSNNQAPLFTVTSVSVSSEPIKSIKSRNNRGVTHQQYSANTQLPISNTAKTPVPNPEAPSSSYNPINALETNVHTPLPSDAKTSDDNRSPSVIVSEFKSSENSHVRPSLSIR
jgi:hypothetical protein